MSQPRVLVIDDDNNKRMPLVEALRLRGFDAHGRDSREVVPAGEDVAAFDFAVVEMMLHGTNGFEVARVIRDTSPAVRVLLTSDYHFTEAQLGRVGCGAMGFVPRPFCLDELSTFLRSKLTMPMLAADDGKQ